MKKWITLMIALGMLSSCISFPFEEGHHGEGGEHGDSRENGR
jgi:hypothetical protein